MGWDGTTPNGGKSRTVRVEFTLSFTIPVVEDTHLWVALVSEEMTVMSKGVPARESRTGGWLVSPAKAGIKYF